MPVAKAKAKHKTNALNKAVQTQRHKQDTVTTSQTVCLDSRTAAAASCFNIEDVGLNKAGKRAATNTNMKTVLTGESSINVDRRVRAAAVPVGVAVGDVAEVAEDLSIAGLVAAQHSAVKQLMPRRPTWSYDLSSGRLHHREVQAFKQWLADVHQLIADRGGYPPAFEQNLQVWRQLWRVLERSDVAVVVVDSRHPLLHLPPALIYHVTRTLRKPLVVVLNKLDAVDPAHAKRWAELLTKSVPRLAGVVGYSKVAVRSENFEPLRVGREALIALCHRALEQHSSEQLEKKPIRSRFSPPDRVETVAEDEADQGEDVSADAGGHVVKFFPSAKFDGKRKGFYFGKGDRGLGYYRDTTQAAPDPDDASAWAAAAKAKAAAALESTSTTSAPQDVANVAFEAAMRFEGDEAAQGRVMLGLVGHPNVGKSSMVNSLMGGKVVSVKATPGHTKTLQTLILDDQTCLCDSPGVVFPRLEVPRETQIVGMLIPIAQVREPFSALRWVMERAITPLNELMNLRPVHLPRVLELQEAGTDALQLSAVDADDGEEMPWSPMLLCAQYASQRGFMNNARPDCMKAGLEILERVLDGRVPYAVAPPAAGAAEAATEGGEESDSGSDWQVADSDYESEEEPEMPADIFDAFGMEKKAPGSGSIASRKKQERRKKLAALAGDD